MPSSDNKKNILTAILLFSLAFVFRLGYLFFLKKYYFFTDAPSSDVLYYQQWADEIARGNWIGHQVFWGMPLYPYFLAVIERLTLGHQEIIRLVHLILGSFNCVLVYYVSLILFSRRVAVLASILTASNFMLIYYDWLMTPVTLIVSLSLLIILALLHLNRDFSLKEWFILGLLIGLSMLADGKFFLFLAILVVVILKTSKNLSFPNACRPARQAFGGDNFRISSNKILICLLLGVTCIVFPVSLRNRIVAGSWILVSAQSGFSFYVGNNARSSGIFENLDFIRPTHAGQDEDQQIRAQQILKRKLNPTEVSDFWRDQAFSFIQNSPSKYFKLLKNKLYYFFLEHEGADDVDLLLQREWKDRFDLNSFSVICPLAILAIGLSFRFYPQTVFINLLIASQILFTLIFFVETKHRATILPFLMIYEAFAFCWLAEQVRLRRLKRVLIISFLVISFFIVFRPIKLSAARIDYLKFYKSGIVFEKQGRYEKAQEFYQQALKLRPWDTNLIYNLAHIFLLKGQTPKAVDYYKKILSVNPDQVDALFNLAYAYEKLDQPESALELYQKALTWQPESLDIHARLANIYRQQGMCEKAAMHYQKILERFPQMTDEINNLIQQCPKE